MIICCFCIRSIGRHEVDGRIEAYVRVMETNCGRAPTQHAMLRDQLKALGIADDAISDGRWMYRGVPIKVLR